MAFCLHHLKCPETTLEGNALWVTAPNQQCKKCTYISGNSWFQLMTFSPLKSKPKHVKVALPPKFWVSFCFLLLYTETLLTVIFLYECPFVQLQSLYVFDWVEKNFLWKIFQFVLLQHCLLDHCLLKYNCFQGKFFALERAFRCLLEFKVTGRCFTEDRT